MDPRARRAASVLLVLGALVVALVVGLPALRGAQGPVGVVGSGEGEGPPAPRPGAPPEEQGAEPAESGAPSGGTPRVIEGRVLGAGGAPVADAEVEVRPDPAVGPTTAVPASVRTTADGGFLLEGVPAATVLLLARHPAYMDGFARMAAGKTSVAITLSPAFVAWFRVAPPGGRPPKDATVTATSGRFQRTQALEPPGPADPPAPEPGLLGPLKVPADTGTEIVFDVRVPGFEPWSIDADAPARGGTRVFAVGLVPTPPQGRARVHLRTEAGAALRYEPDGATASLERVDGTLPRPIAPREAGGDLLFERVPPGRYRVTVLARGRAPATAGFEVKADEETSVEAVHGTEARARIRVLSTEGRALRVRLTREDRPVPVFVEPPSAAGPGRDAGTTSFVAGADGVVVGGLAPGPCVVEVISPDFAPVGARFEARAGETVDVDVRPTAR